SNDAETVIERIVPRLQHGNSGVVLASVKVISYMMNYVAQTDALEPILRKLSPPLVTLLTSGPEVQYITLRNIQLLLQRWPTILQNQLRAFFCKYDDPIYVKLAKLEVILSLTTEENARVVLTELVEYATEIDVDFVRKAVRSIGRIAIKIELAADRCVRALLDLIQTKVNYVVQEAIIVIRDIFRKYPNRYETIISTLCENLDTLDEPEARAAMIWIVGQYADRIDNSDRVLGTFLETFLDDPAEVQLAMLTAVVKLFIMRPTAGQDMVPKMLKWATEEVDSPDIRDRGFIYWRLLSTDPEMARAVVLSDKPEISAEGERLEMPLLEELLLQVGTLSSIYRKPPCTFIPFAKKRVLGASPALTRLTIAPPPVSRLPRTMSSMGRPQQSGKQQPQSQPQTPAPSGDRDAATADPSRSSSVQLSASALDVTSAGAGGMSNPYISDITPLPMQGNDAVLIDLMSMEDDEYAADGGAAINSGGMVGFNANFGMSAMNMASLDPATTSAIAAPDSQVLNSAFDAAGLDALASLSAASPMARVNGRTGSPMPDLMRQFTSSFDLGSAPTSGASITSGAGSVVAITSPGGNPQQPIQVSSSAPYSMTSANASSMPALFGTSAFPAALSPSSTIFNTSSVSSPFTSSGPITPGIQSYQPLSAPASNTATSALYSTVKAESLQQQQQAAGAASAQNFSFPTSSSAANSASLKKDVDDLAAQMYNTGFTQSYTSTTTASYAAASGSSGAAAPYVPSQQVLLDAQQSQGLEILGTFARRNGQVQMELSLSNKSGIPIGDFAIQFNKNTFGLTPSASFNVGTLSPMSAADVVLPLALGGPSMPMQPLTNIQIAIKCTAGVFYFQTQYSLHILLSEGGQSDQGTFLRMWKSIPENMQSSHTAHNLRFSSMEDMRNKLNMNSVFTVAQRSVGNATHFYTSSKMSDDVVFYSEIKVANNFQAAIIVTKSTNTQLIPLYQKAIEDICTAF
ncbi:hypothetical protein H4R99_005826, partial [Coemansia sp. RSA 1722]